MTDTTNAAAVASSSVNAYIQCIELPIPTIYFQYNPTSLSVTQKAHWTSPRNPNNSAPKQYLGVGAETLTVEILLDAFAIPPMPPDVTIELLKLMMEPTITTSVTSQGRAPMVIFGWGPNIIMDQAIITSITIDHQRFLLGVPTRASVKVSLQAVPLGNLPGTNPTSGGLATRRTHTVVEGDTLASIAYKEYNDPNYWRALAEANDVDDPMRVRSGTVLIVPEKRDAEALLGGSRS